MDVSISCSKPIVIKLDSGERVVVSLNRQQCQERIQEMLASLPEAKQPSTLRVIFILSPLSIILPFNSAGKTQRGLFGLHLGIKGLPAHAIVLFPKSIARAMRRKNLPVELLPELCARGLAHEVEHIKQELHGGILRNVVGTIAAAFTIGQLVRVTSGKRTLLGAALRSLELPAYIGAVVAMLKAGLAHPDIYRHDHLLRENEDEFRVWYSVVSVRKL